MNTTSTKNDFKSTIFLPSLLLMGGFGIAYNLAIALHEFGHVIAYLIDGATVTEYVLNPFSWSWAEGRGFSNRIFALWGGVLFGQLMALLPLLLTMLIKNQLFDLQARLLAATAFLVNGIYLTAGAALNFGDGGVLQQLGVNGAWIYLVGIVYLVIAFFLWAGLQGQLGLDKKSSCKSRLIVIMAGIAPYMVLIFLFNLVFNSRQLLMWGGLAAVGIFSAIPIALLGHLLARRVSERSVTNGAQLFRTDAIVLLSLALAIVLMQFLVFGNPPNPF